MKGCHNCKHLKRLNRNLKYEKSPCSGCRAMFDPPLLSMEQLNEDLAGDEELLSCHEFSEVEEKERNKVLKAMAQCVVELVNIFEENPLTFKITMSKIKSPHLSYSEIARLFKCKKQNIQYHLEKAVKICPDLKFALLIDRRFNKRDFPGGDNHEDENLAEAS